MMEFHASLDDYFTLIPEAGVHHEEYMTRLIKDEDTRVFVAEHDGQLLGYLVAGVNEYPPIYLHKNYGHIGAISVTASARRMGIGTKLLDAALDWFLAKGLQRVECGVAIENPVSQAFWKGREFRGFMEKHVLDLSKFE
jgi:ribosomal protein S18 acetylase RimI-like enzyme